MLRTDYLGRSPLFVVALVIHWATVAAQNPSVQSNTSEQTSQIDAAPRDPGSVTLIPMDLKAAESVLPTHDLNDDGSLNKTEWKRMAWSDDEVRRFDLNRSGDLQHLEIALIPADGQLDKIKTARSA